MKTLAAGKFKDVCLHTHFNHPNEVTPIVELAMRRLHEHGLFVRNQTVLLRGVNDDVDTLQRLSVALGGVERAIELLLTANRPLLVNGEPSYSLKARRGEVVRFLLTNGEMVTATESVNDATLQLLGEELNYTVEVVLDLGFDVLRTGFHVEGRLSLAEQTCRCRARRPASGSPARRGGAPARRDLRRDRPESHAGTCPAPPGCTSSGARSTRSRSGRARPPAARTRRLCCWVAAGLI